MSNQTSTNLALQLARRQKRLNYWLTKFSLNKHIKPEFNKEVEEKINTFRLLLSKMVLAKTENEKTETEERLKALEQLLNNYFEDRRLMTSNIGVPAVGDK